MGFDSWLARSGGRRRSSFPIFPACSGFIDQDVEGPAPRWNLYALRGFECFSLYLTSYAVEPFAC